MQQLMAQRSNKKNKMVSPRADSIRNAMQYRRDSLMKRQDSLYEVREILKAKRLREQEDRYEKQEAIRRKKGIPLTQEMGFGYRLASDGWAFFLQRGFIHTDADKGPHTDFIYLDFSEKKNPKEKNIVNETFSTFYPNEPKPLQYKYGKINNFYQLRFGYGNMKCLTRKLEQRHVDISWVYGAGISLGMLKPYYLDLLIPEGSGFVRQFANYDEKTKPYFLDTANRGYIIGGADFTKGISEIKFKPGLSLRTGFYFDYSPSRKTFTGIELGTTLDVYAQKIPIMAEIPARAFFWNVYADIRFGKRWE